MSSRISTWGFVAPSTFGVSLKIPKHCPDLAGGAVLQIGEEGGGGVGGWGKDPKAAGSTPAAVATLFPAFAGSVLDPLITYLSTVESNGLHQEKKT